MTIICSKCGSSNDDESIYCGSCGSLLSSSYTSSSPPDQTPLMETAPPGPGRRIPNRTRNIVIALAVIIILLIVVAFISAKDAGPTAAQSQTLNIVNGSLTVEERGFLYYQFTVPTGTTNAQVEGSFTVKAVAGSGIQVYVMDNLNLSTWANSPSNAHVSAYYKSGQVTSGSINIRLSPGTYYLIFDNTFSIFYPKDVQANVSLAYNS
jgi:zinc-ribbon domain